MDLTSVRVRVLLLALILGFGVLAEAAPGQLNPADLASVGRPIALAAEGCNRAFRFSVSRAELRADHAGHGAPPGQRWLVLDLAVENRMPVDLLYDLDYREDLLVASLSRQLYLLVNGHQVSRRALFGDAEAGAIPNNFVLSRWGEQIEGRMVYAVPAAGVESLSLRYYHDQYAPVVIALLGETAGERPQALDRSVQANDLMEIGVFGVESTREWNGRAAPDGMTWLAVDLRGRGFWSIDADALALDREASPEARVRLPKVMEYVEAQGLLQVVVDGEHAFVRDPELGTLSAEPAFLPDAMAGGVGVFPVPEGSESVMLEVHFPEFRGPGIDEPIPESMMFALEGQRVAPHSGKPLGLIEDVPTPFTLHAVDRTDTFGGVAAPANEQLLVLDASMRNTSAVGGMMSISSRVDLVTDGGELAEFVGIFNAGPMILAEPFWLPAGGDSRRFHLVYRAAEGVVPESLEYRGVSVNTRLALP